MLIKSLCVAEAPSRGAAAAGWKPGIRGADKAAAGYLAGLAGSFRPAQVAASPVQAGSLQVSAVTKSTVQKNATNQHNTIQVTRLVPVIQGVVGPHPAREPGPA
jgi:hypothetical protein